ncbi:GlcNAc-transferase family protein [Paraburkholderia caballeronis]|uniref:Glycosyltransferase (GlcNAc) n=1 Tax=Paraburkholderia caballeronis TaxID=416943 RepID=A0A1H7FKZ8_9BURK|nr:GlcNAc-transferase family protein [Paraburkholderia caballeronis]PXW24945.1 UDP-N-acetylglucosamine (GlcNAc):hydroxyproline polypeptide GlcNAc-transferase [Paraburkholderia caballeronis]PXX00675.1 UDP-N-acetylglucosamine (GlcNAc):hydroxyproline polypeptide GlcNAc-transferase [Paraburkholderia caballeronis]RAJ98738.1 UDP-N-acetylglucosamine (GlcNAc):hydroxyproline polypeptide GlcNAc-transferase [Paraburkholderia caballeronis]SEE71381.1 Glycosyltransferase (GlcNAc) [Paraburkholderia caballeron
MTTLPALHQDAHDDSIFVQIASYRDPQLLPTLVDLIGKSRRPRRMRIVVCWQHAPDEPLGAFWRHGFGKWRVEKTDAWDVHHLDYLDAKVELIDVPHLATQGACWARNLIQQRYRGERYTLQLDSHHRFVVRWDALLIDMLESLRDESPKPLLTAYLPAFRPDGGPPPADSAPLLMVFSRFSSDGVAQFRSNALPDWPTLTRPVRARFYSAHFAFADGHFAENVQHDPDYFFQGEEISISVRAFTHGYDLYHPHRVAAWHEYTRKQSAKVWDDHSTGAKENGHVEQHWSERNARAMQRNRELFGTDGHSLADDRFGRYGFGTVRTIADYEAYAGLDFARRGVQQTLLDGLPPVPGAVRPVSDAAWCASMLRSNDVRVCVHRSAFEREATAADAQPVLSSATLARVAIYDAAGTALHHRTLDAEQLVKHRSADWLDLHAAFEATLERIPARYVVELANDAGQLLSRVEQPIDG